ncbi:SprT-like family-domain-containing protein [Leucosporidium creatinivorum]|uniref:SprT-like family-domain-containing protein n=1 Tax=Leucosporidium creatinivorum TaxID=106004 RepID=A0A1Y2G3F1_9BASI|nr:SprT-like family-domain-containing protein [Leucosporidium creatinivorum]
MAAAYDSDSEEDLPTLDELLGRRRIPAKTPTIVLQQQEVVAAVSVTPNRATTAPTTSNITLQSPSSPHSTPTRRSPRLSSPAAVPPQQTTPITYSSLNHPSSSARRRSLANELFPPSPASAPPQQPSFTARTDLYSYREPSPSIISDSEPDLPSTVKPRRSEKSGGEARELDRRASRESFWVEDSEDERVQQEIEGEESRSSAQIEPVDSAAGPRSKGRASVAVYDIDSDDEAPLAPPQAQDDGFGVDGLLIHDPSFATRTPSTRPQLPLTTDTPRASKPSTPRRTPATLRRRITISILDSDSDSSSDSEHVVSKPRHTQPSRQKEVAEEAEVVTVDDEDSDGPQSKSTKAQTKELVVTLPSERSMGGTPIRRRSETPEEQVLFGEDDPNEGVLTYEPTPRSRKPVKLPSAAGKNFPSSPSRTPGKARKPVGPSKRSVSIDLTGSSDSDSEEVPKASTNRPPTILFPPPRGPPKPRLTPTPAATPTATPKRSSKSAPSTPSRKTASTTLLTDAQRESLPLKLIVELDRAVFRRSWSGGKCNDGPGEATGVGLPSGIEVRWNKKLRNTAGRASWKRVKTGGTTTHITSIDLATKVTDTEEKLRHTLAHELCHIAAWVLSGEIKPPHGDAFKLWAKRIMSVRSDITITTTHSYEISYKFRWQCQNTSCAKIFSRHSRSIDPGTQGCPCGSRLTEIDADGQPKIVRRTPAKRSGWQEFLAITAPAVRLENPGIRNDDVFKVVAERYRAVKSAAEAREAEQQGLEEGMGRLGV